MAQPERNASATRSNRTAVKADNRNDPILRDDYLASIFTCRRTITEELDLLVRRTGVSEDDDVWGWLCGGGGGGGWMKGYKSKKDNSREEYKSSVTRAELVWQQPHSRSFHEHSLERHSPQYSLLSGNTSPGLQYPARLIRIITDMGLHLQANSNLVINFFTISNHNNNNEI